MPKRKEKINCWFCKKEATVRGGQKHCSMKCYLNNKSTVMGYYKKPVDYEYLKEKYKNHERKNIIDLPNEIWAVIVGFPEYQISTYGRVYSNIKDRLLKPTLKGRVGDFYYQIKSRNKQIAIHRAVAKAFIPNYDNKPQVNHIDGNKLNNNVENLEWATSSENQIHAIKTGLRTITKGDELNRSNILSSADIIEMMKWFKEGKSNSEIGKHFGINRSNVWQIRTGRNWSHVTGFKKIYKKSHKCIM